MLRELKRTPISSGTLFGDSGAGWEAASASKKTRSPIAAASGGIKGSTQSCASFEAQSSMPFDLMPRMFLGFRLQRTTTSLSCTAGHACLSRRLKTQAGQPGVSIA